MTHDSGANTNGETSYSRPFFVVVMGVASSGKSTIAKALNEKLGLPYIEGDDLHPQSNIDKMSQGIPLADEDREPWLELIRTTAENVVAEHEAKARAEGVGEGVKGRYGAMATCSALKRYYRDILRGTHPVHKLQEQLHSASHKRLPTYFVYIRTDEQLLRNRIAKRQGHFMKPQMLNSQLAILESPEGEQGVVTIPLDATTEEQVQIAVEGLRGLIGDLEIASMPSIKQGKEEPVSSEGIF